MEKKRGSGFVPMFLLGCSLVGMGLGVVYSLKIHGKEGSSYSRLEKFAEKDGKKGLSITEEAEMYQMCGVGDKPKDYVLTEQDIKRGIEAYEMMPENEGGYVNGIK